MRMFVYVSDAKLEGILDQIDDRAKRGILDKRRRQRSAGTGGSVKATVRSGPDLLDANEAPAIGPHRIGGPAGGSARPLLSPPSEVRLGVVNEFGIPATDEAAEYFREIADAMVQLYSIPRSEAIGRIRKFWTGQSFLTEYVTHLIQHQVPEQWAELIYYGRKGNWGDRDSWQPVPYSAQ